MAKRSGHVPNTRVPGQKVRPAPKPHRPPVAPPDPLAYTQGPLPLPAIQAAAQTAGNLRYGGVEAAQALQGRQIPAWYQEYKQTLLTPQQVAAQYAPAIQASQATAAQSGQTVLKDVDPNSQAGQQDVLAAKAREALVNLGTGVLQAGQQADTTYYQGRQGVASAAQVGAQSDLASRVQATAGEKGAYVQDQVTQGIKDERQYGLGVQHQQAENAAFGVRQYTAQQTARARRQSLRQSRQQARQRQRDKNQDQSLARQKFRAQQKKDALKAQGGGAKPKPAYTTAQSQKAKVDLRKAVGLVQRGAKRSTGGGGYWNQAYDQLLADGMDPAIARAAIQLVRGGKVGPQTRTTLVEDYGITKFPRGSRRKPASHKSVGPYGKGPSGQVRPG